MKGMHQTDHQWIESVIAEYDKRLVAYAHNLLGSRDNAKDAVQETFIALCREPRKQVEAKLKSWLFTVCRNRCFDRLRKEKPMQPLEPDVMDKQFAGGDAPDDHLSREENFSQLLTHVNKLPLQQREVLQLKFINGMSYREISAVTQLSETNVGFLIHRSIKTLRQRLNHQPLS